MASRTHEITRYNYSLSSTCGGNGVLQLWNDGREIVRIEFVDEDAPLPAPTLDPDLKCAAAVFRRSMRRELVDMLRHESPVKVTLNDQPPGFVFVHTGAEPVGEGEK